MGLRVEEDFGVVDVLVGGVLEVGVGEGFEVFGGNEGGHADEVVVQEVVEGGEALVAGEKGGRRFPGWVIIGGGKGDVVFGGEGEEKVGLERAFDMEVVLAFWKSSQELVHRSLTHGG